MVNIDRIMFSDHVEDLHRYLGKSVCDFLNGFELVSTAFGLANYPLHS